MTVKTAISLDDTLFEQVESLVQELNVSRSRLFTMAMQEFIKRREAQRIMAALNEVYSNGPDAEEVTVLRAMKRYHQKLVADEAW